MLNGIGHQVRFGYNLTREELMGKFDSTKASEPSSYSTAPAAKLSENEEPKKSSHKLLYTLGTVAVLAGTGYLAKNDKLGKTAKEWFDKAHDPAKKFCIETVKPNLTGALEWAKRLIGKGKEVAPEVAKTVETAA